MRRAARILGGLFVAGVVSLVIALVVLAWLQPNSVILPNPTGPYPVGRAFYDWRDEERIDPLAPDPGTKRELTVWIWYPAAPNGGESRAAWMPDPLRKAMEPNPDVLLVRAFVFLMRQLTTDRANVTAHAIENADVHQTPKRLPILLMKPALGAAAVQNAVLAEELASHGYVVVGSDSPHTTPAVVYQDGRVVRRTKAGAPSETAPGPENELAPGQPNDLSLPVLDVWVADQRFLLDRLSELNESDPSRRFTDRLDLETVGAFGHSFGGATALQFCRDDPRCKAGVDLDGMMLGEVVRTGLPKPFLFLFANRPWLFDAAETELPGDARAMAVALRRIRGTLPNAPSLLLLDGAAHFNFFDQALLSEAHVWRLFGALGSIDQRRALVVTRRYVRAFFDTHLKSAPDSLLGGPSAEFPEMRFQ